MCLVILATNGCSYLHDLTLVGQVLRGADRLPIVGATVALLSDNHEHCSSTTDDYGRWTLSLSINNRKFRPDKDGRYWLGSDPPYPDRAPRAKDSYTIRATTDEGSLECPLPRISASKPGEAVSASMWILVDAGFQPEYANPENANTTEPSHATEPAVGPVLIATRLAPAR